MAHYNEFKLFAQRVGLIGLINLLTSLSGVLLIPILTKTLSIEEFGIWAQIMVTIGLIPSIVMLGLPYTMVRFLAVAKKKEDIQEDFYSIASLVLVTSAIVSILSFLFAKSLAILLFDNNILVTKMLSLIIFIECLNSLMLNFFRTFQQIRKYALFTFSMTCLNFLLVSYFVLSDQGIIGAIIGVLAARCLIFLIMTLIIIRMIGFKIPEFRNIWDYLAFGLPTVPGNLSSWVVTSSDRYVIGILLGTAYVGYYSPGYTLGNVIQILAGPLILILPPVLSKYYDENNIEAVKTVLRYSFKYFLLFAIPSAFGISLLSKPMLVILSTPDIASKGYMVTPFVAFSSVFFGATVVISQIIILEKRTVITGIIYMVAAIFNFVLNMILVPHMGITGAAFTTLIAYLLLFALGTYYSFRYLRFDICPEFILKSILASIAMSLVIFMWNPEGWLSILVIVWVCAIVYVVTLLLFKGISRKEIEFFRGLIQV